MKPKSKEDIINFKDIINVIKHYEKLLRYSNDSNEITYFEKEIEKLKKRLAKLEEKGGV